MHPHVGAIGYTLGGGIGLLARRYWFAADHVRWVDVVTADGRLRHVTAEPSDDSELFRVTFNIPPERRTR